MSWIDFIVILIFLAVTILESVRGFGRALFDTIALILVLKASKLLSPSLAGSISFLSAPHANEGFSFLLLFVVMGAVGLILAKLIYESTLWTFDAFDALLGGLLGLIASGAVANALLHGLFLWGAGGTAHPQAFATYVQHTLSGQEFLEWRTYNTILGLLRSLGK